MTQGIQTVLELAGSKGGITVEVTVSEQYDALQNISDLTVGLRVKSSQYSSYTYYPKGSLSVAGVQLVQMQSVVPTHHIQLSGKNTYVPVKKWNDGYTDSPWSLKGISHNTDGSKTVALVLDIKGYTSGGGGGSGWSVSLTKEISLTHIPRASTVAATDANIGAVSMIAVTRRSAGYTHSIAWSFGTLSGYLSEDGTALDFEQKLTAVSVPFHIPNTFFGEIPNSRTGTCTLTCKTYWGDTVVGTAQQYTFTVTAPQSICGPEVLGTVKDINQETVALTGNEDILVRGISTALCTITAQAKESAAITQMTIGGAEVTENTRTIENIGGGTVLFSCCDSRGYAASATVEKQLVPYSLPTANATASRTDPTSGNVRLLVEGTCFVGSFGAQENVLAVSCSANNGAPMALNTQLSENTYRAEVILEGLDYRQSHTITVTVTDSLYVLEKSASVGKGIPVFDWGENDFCFHVPVTAPSVNGIGKVAENHFLVGSQSDQLAQKTPEEVRTLIGGASQGELAQCLKQVRIIMQNSQPQLVQLEVTGTLYNRDTVMVMNANIYVCFLIVLSTAGSTGAKVSTWLPAGMIPASQENAYTWSINDASNAKRFIAYYSGSTLVLTADGTTGNGVANETPTVYGLRLGIVEG